VTLLLRGSAFVALAALLAAVGCRRAASSDDVVGTWVITDSSRSRLGPTARNAPGRLVIDRQGTFVAKGCPPDLLYVAFDDTKEPVSGRGEWRLASDNGTPAVHPTFRLISAGQQAPVPYDTPLYLSTRPVGLYYFQGDPDSSVRIIFERK
jgi:hypothetical protein